MVVTPLDPFPALKFQCCKQILCKLKGPWNKANKEGCKEKKKWCKPWLDNLFVNSNVWGIWNCNIVGNAMLSDGAFFSKRTLTCNTPVHWQITSFHTDYNYIILNESTFNTSACSILINNCSGIVCNYCSHRTEFPTSGNLYAVYVEHGHCITGIMWQQERKVCANIK